MRRAAPQLGNKVVERKQASCRKVAADVGTQQARLLSANSEFRARKRKQALAAAAATCQNLLASFSLGSH